MTVVDIKHHDFILNLADELLTEYVASKKCLLSDLTPNTGIHIFSCKRKQGKINHAEIKDFTVVVIDKC